MLKSLSEYKLFQSFRIKVEKADELRFLVKAEDDMGRYEYIEDAMLTDISVTGLGFSTSQSFSKETDLEISLQFKRHNLQMSGTIVRMQGDPLSDLEFNYGIEFDEYDRGIQKFLETFINSFSNDRLKQCLFESAIEERYTKDGDGLEMFSLLLSLFKDITNYGNNEKFVSTLLQEVVRLLEAQRASIFLINPETNQLEAVAALGTEKETLRFDYRLGVAGSVFTTGVSLNLDVENDETRFNDVFDGKTGFSTRSIICHPIFNNEDKIIGVVEVLNKRGASRFSVEDEKTMKVLALTFSSIYNSYNPISHNSQIRRFSKPFDRKHALIGRTPHVGMLRNTIGKIKDIDCPILIFGERGVGKSLYANIIHHEGKRGLKSFQIIDCTHPDKQEVNDWMFKDDRMVNRFALAQGGTLLIKEIGDLSIEQQKQLLKVLQTRGLDGSTMSFDARLIFSSTADLGKMVDDGKFLRQLFEEVNTSFIQIEPLRRRGDDVVHLVDYFLKAECKKQGFLLKSFSPKAMDRLKDYDWPGNVQELKTCIERAVLYNPRSHIISEADLQNLAAPLFDTMAKSRMFGDLPHVSDHSITLKDRLAIVEREMILAEVKRNNGNKSKAAKEMGISREALRKKMILSNKVLTGLEERKTSEKEEVVAEQQKDAA